MRKLVLAIALLSLWVATALAGPQPMTGAAPAGSVAASAVVSKDSLVGFLRSLNDEALKEGGIPDKNNPVRYISAYQDLDGDGTPEAIVYMLGRNWCGSGGCSTLILKQKDRSWTKVAEITLSFPPIYVLSDVSNGWHGIGVWVRVLGGGTGYEVELSFDGKTYPRNPSTHATRRLKGEPAGKMLIASADDAKLLYEDAAPH